MVNQMENRILIVEDSLLNQKLLYDMLSTSYTLAKAGTAEEAFFLVESFQPDLILLDIILPDANGFDLLKTLKEFHETKRIPVIIVSGMDSDEDEEKGFLLGAVDYIKKPFKNAIVKARIKTQIQIINQISAIERMSFVDSLTGVFNRRAFDCEIKYEWGRAVREHAPISLLMLDVDKFKIYNDNYGHPQGDVMLQSVARALQSSLNRSVDILCRYGGEEFAVVLPDVDLAGAAIVAERMRKSIEDMQVVYESANIVTRSTISIGVASIKPDMQSSISDFISKADSMLYKAKENGRNQVQY